MALVNHDRLDKLLLAVEYTDIECGCLNLRTGQAEYCGYDCPTLKARMTANDDPGQPINRVEGLAYVPFNPATDMVG